MAVKYNIKVFECEACGHRWLPEKAHVPTHCPSRKCRSRLWNESGLVVGESGTPAVVSPVVTAVAASIPGVGRAVEAPLSPKMTPRCPTHRIPLVRNEETGLWTCRVTKCRTRVDDEAVKLAYETADWSTV